MAFANTVGGTLLVGIKFVSRRVCGIGDVLKMEERLANLIADSIRPQLVPDIEVVSRRNLNVNAVNVYPSNTHPHYLVAPGAELGTFSHAGLSFLQDAGAHRIIIIARHSRFRLQDSGEQNPLYLEAPAVGIDNRAPKRDQSWCLRILIEDERPYSGCFQRECRDPERDESVHD